MIVLDNINIKLIILAIDEDQLRTPQWFPAPATLNNYLPAIANLQESSVSFKRSYTAVTVYTAICGTHIGNITQQWLSDLLDAETPVFKSSDDT